MNLHLLRHAKTNQQSETGNDFDRKLLPKGWEQAEVMANHLSHFLDFSKISIHCSTSARTKQTLEVLSPKIPMANIHFSDNLYHATHLDLLKYVNEIESHKDLLLIGHNDGISDFATYLTDQFVSLKTCGYIHLKVEIDSWAELSKGQAKIIADFRPEVD